MRKTMILLPFLASLLVAGGGARAQDVGRGEAAFKRCAICHAVASGTGPVIGPHLGGVVGRMAGSLPDFSYSKPMATSGLTWDASTLDAFITKPQSVVKGTRMPFAGLPDAQERADLIAYLATLK